MLFIWAQPDFLTLGAEARMPDMNLCTHDWSRDNLHLTSAAQECLVAQMLGGVPAIASGPLVPGGDSA